MWKCISDREEVSERAKIGKTQKNENGRNLSPCKSLIEVLFDLNEIWSIARSTTIMVSTQFHWKEEFIRSKM